MVAPGSIWLLVSIWQETSHGDLVTSRDHRGHRAGCLLGAEAGWGEVHSTLHLTGSSHLKARTGQGSTLHIPERNVLQPSQHLSKCPRPASDMGGGLSTVYGTVHRKRAGRLREVRHIQESRVAARLTGIPLGPWISLCAQGGATCPGSKSSYLGSS